MDILTIKGSLEMTEANELREMFVQLSDAGRFCIVIDARLIDYINSHGLRVLIEAQKRAQEWTMIDGDSGDVRIVHLRPDIRTIFELTGFTSVFQIFDDLVEAVGSF